MYLSTGMCVCLYGEELIKNTLFCNEREKKSPTIKSRRRRVLPRGSCHAASTRFPFGTFDFRLRDFRFHKGREYHTVSRFLFYLKMKTLSIGGGTHTHTMGCFDSFHYVLGWLRVLP